MMHITRKHVISTAHRIYEHNGKCERLHGHNYVILIRLSAASLDNLGMIIDFGEVKRLLCGALDEAWDHRTVLYDIDPLAKQLSVLEEDGSLVAVPFNPTAENMATYLGTDFFPKILRENGVDERVFVSSVTVFETEKSSATWELDQAGATRA